MVNSTEARDAYVQAEVTTALSHQIRAIRQQRGWSQGELAERLKTTQAVVSRLENPAYGRHSLQTLLQLSQAFDTGLQVRFVSLVTMLKETFHPNPADRLVPTFEEEAQLVGFDDGSSTYHRVIDNPTDGLVTNKPLKQISMEQPSSVEWLQFTSSSMHSSVHATFHSF
jgi:transcriptional regulator with XRE-family HTH domain